MGKYKHGKVKIGIEFKNFNDIMATKKFLRSLRDKSLLAFLYYFGTRISEALRLRKTDFEIRQDVLVINCPALKGGERLPLEIGLDLPFVNLIIKQVEKTRKTKMNPTRLVWNMHRTTAWRMIKRSMGEKYYPHFFRLNRATQFLSDPTTTIIDMKSWFGWQSVSTIDSYMGLSRRGVTAGRRRIRDEVNKS